MGTGYPLRWARRRTAATGDGDTFVQDVTDSDHLSSFQYEERGHGKAGTRAGGEQRGRWGRGAHCVERGGGRGDVGDGASASSGKEEDGDKNAEVT